MSGGPLSSLQTPADNVRHVETSQVIFAIALGIIAVGITAFAFYVAWSTTWSDRWYVRRRAPEDHGG